ncbi:hypothetical protein [Amycolatopsis magusensis]|uniref:hypothetical protein n=1 Tax=Amycolatopsis magusensis TaxID=882444 RepID=UPI0037B6F904
MTSTTHVLHLAKLNSGHFEFVAAGRDGKHALRVLQTAWDVHAAQTGATYTWDDLVDEVETVVLAPGIVLRDGAPMDLA